MRILIGYDGSACSEAALDDLKTAGLPQDVNAVVMSVAEVWLPPPPEGMSIGEYAKDLQSHKQPFKAWQDHAKVLTEVESLVKQAEARLRTNFPNWEIKAEATYGSPAWEILAKADEMKADLIVVGSHGRSALGRLVLGSISQKVLTEANCSVRIARGRVEVDSAPPRIVIGFDGSKGACAAVDAVALRPWPEQTKVRLAAVTDPITPTAVGFVLPAVSDWVDVANEGEHEWLRKLADKSIKKLDEGDLLTEFVTEFGNPKQMLVDLAESWHADSIFVGANRFGSRIERFLLGSVSAAVAARAHCSVEIVRTASK